MTIINSKNGTNSTCASSKLKSFRLFNSIVAIDEQNAIGKDGGLLCHLSNDLKHFKNVTSGLPIVMGRRTYESLPKGALPNRTNIVITSDNPENYPDCIVVRSLEEAIEKAPSEKEIFIIGGGQLYRSSLQSVQKLFLTRTIILPLKMPYLFPEINFMNGVLKRRA